jgi:adenylate kinase family enzyme
LIFGPHLVGGPVTFHVRPRRRHKPIMQHLERVVVVGTSCAGKTTFARDLATALACSVIQLDELYWGPDWTARPQEEFVGSVARATAGPRWVVDGNYSIIRDVVWTRATAIIWLNLSFPVIFARAVRRTVVRSISQEPLYAGNRESLRRAFFTRESILLWVLTTYWERRRRYPTLRASPNYPGLAWFELKRPGDVSAFLNNVRVAA